MTVWQGKHPERLWDTLEAVLYGGLALQGDQARSLSQEVALAASLGYITVVSPDGREYSPRWRITPLGLTVLEDRNLYD